jgi:hypothetical protein
MTKREKKGCLQYSFHDYTEKEVENGEGEKKRERIKYIEFCVLYNS